MMNQILATILFIFLISQVSFAQVYKWVDEKGVTHFTDDMTQLPEKHRSKAEGVQLPQEYEDTKVEEEPAPKKKEDPYKDRLGRGEDYWKGRVDEWRKKLRELQDRFETLRTKYNELTERHNDSRTMAVRTDLRRERDQVKGEIDLCKAQIEEARGMLEKKIPEEAELYKAKPEWVKR
jgi:chromosome segregation ATPase